FGAGFENDAHQIVFLGGSFGNDDVALFVKHPGDRAGFRHVAAVFAEGVADFTDRAVAIVGIDIEQDRHPAGAVALERELFVGSTGQFTRAAKNGPLGVAGRKVLSLGRQDGAAQAWVGIGIAAILGGNRNFLDQAGENLASLGVQSAFFMLDCRPF